MSLFSMSFLGGALILLGSYESLSSSSSPKSSSKRFSTITLISTLVLSLLIIINSLHSLLNAVSLNDTVGSSLQLQLLSISSLFLLFSLLSLLTFPYPLLALILLFAFTEEFLLFHLHLKDPNGIENRYYDLMLVPVLICIVSTLIELLSSNNNNEVPKLGRGLGLVLQGSWFIQMGFSFFTDLIANNCALYYKSRGNYTVRCKDHMDTHRGGAIAVLLFNCHVAFLVAVFCGVFSVVGKRFVVDRSRYRPLGEEGVGMRMEGKFTLDSDEDDGGEVKQEINGSVVELSVNGNGNGNGSH